MALVVGGLVLVITGTGAFTSTTTEKQMPVDIADESAYLDIEAADPTVSQTGVDYSLGQLPVIGQNRMLWNSSNNTRVVLGTITNRFSTPLTSITVSVPEDHSGAVTVRNPTVPDTSIPSGHSSQLIAAVDCNSLTGGTEMVNVSIEATSSETSISTDRSVPVTCAGGPSQTGATNVTTQPFRP
ncbi:hypothetical protein EIK79_07450 [Halocatena pleomorpha]|uniref:Uncharacterized protein n=1 Tax=Halocatena pleomorpha TaxID=1785090 RepID=A0A3P3RF29_9EURY|nr:hypothetical protein EIK79_07450 [Halocatena pleomorpha]